MIDSMEETAHVHLFNLDHYMHEKIYVNLYKDVEPSSTLRGIVAAHCNVLVESLLNVRYAYVSNLMTIHFSMTTNPESITYATAVRNIDDMKLQRDLICTVMFDRHHQRRFVELVRADMFGNGCGLTTVRLRVLS